MAVSRWKGGLPRSVRKNIQRQQRNARRRAAYHAQNAAPPTVNNTLFDWNRNQLEVAHVYKRNSKIMPAPKGYVAVKLKTGEKGWVKENTSRFIGDDENMFMIESIEKAAHVKGKWSWMYANMDGKQKARYMERAADIDWTSFWKVHYNARTGLLDSESVEQMEDIMNYAFYGL